MPGHPADGRGARPARRAAGRRAGGDASTRRGSSRAIECVGVATLARRGRGCCDGGPAGGRRPRRPGSTWARTPRSRRRSPPRRTPSRSPSAPFDASPTWPRSAASSRRGAALEIALAGGHGLLLVGPPGSGKTLLARTIPGLLPPLDDAEALAATIVASVAGDGAAVARPPGAGPRPAPHAVVRGDGRRRAAAVAGRGHARRPRRPVPRRAAGVRPGRARGAPPAARGRPRLDRPGRPGDDVPGPLPARRRDEPVPVRLRGQRAGPVPLRAGRAGALHGPGLGAAPRPDRPVGDDAEGRAGRADRRRRAGGRPRRSPARIADARARQRARGERPAERPGLAAAS